MSSKLAFWESALKKKGIMSAIAENSEHNIGDDLVAVLDRIVVLADLIYSKIKSNINFNK